MSRPRDLLGPFMCWIFRGIQVAIQKVTAEETCPARKSVKMCYNGISVTQLRIDEINILNKLAMHRAIKGLGTKLPEKVKNRNAVS